MHSVSPGQPVVRVAAGGHLPPTLFLIMSIGQNLPLSGTASSCRKVEQVVGATLRKQGVQFELYTYQGVRGIKPKYGSFSYRPAVYAITNERGLTYVGSASNTSNRLSAHRDHRVENAVGLNHIEQGEPYTIHVFYLDKGKRERTSLEQSAMDSLRGAGVAITNSNRSDGTGDSLHDLPSCYRDSDGILTRQQLSARLSSLRYAIRGKQGRGVGSIMSFASLEGYRRPQGRVEEVRTAHIERVLAGLDMALNMGQCFHLANAMNECVNNGKAPVPVTPEQVEARLIELNLIDPQS